eukprot:3589787-Ditylum_brightwellii.AAC.1
MMKPTSIRPKPNLTRRARLDVGGVCAAAVAAYDGAVTEVVIVGVFINKNACEDNFVSGKEEKCFMWVDKQNNS